jgi:hypothetical protein
VTPSVTGLHQAEQQIAEWLAWDDIEGSPTYKELDSYQQDTVRKRKRDALKDAQTAVRNAYELVIFLDKDGSVQSKKITLGAQSLLNTLLQESALRLFREKIDAETIMPNGLYPVWPASDSSVRVRDLYQEFGRQPALPKLLSPRTVLNTIDDAALRGILAVRCLRSDGSEQWFWRSPIDMSEWEKTAEAWLPSKAKLNSLTPAAVLPHALPGLWPKDASGVTVATACSWFDGGHRFEEETQPGYPPELRDLPRVELSIVQKAIARAVQEKGLWLVFGNDSIFGVQPTTLQMDSNALLYQPPSQLSAIDLLPNNLPAAWSKDGEPRSSVDELYSALKSARGKPWPPRLFIESLNAAIGQGFLSRNGGSSPINSLQKDGNIELVIKLEAPMPPEPTPLPTGRRSSSLATLSLAEVQDFADQIHALSKPLAGCDPRIEVRVTTKATGKGDINEANKILGAIKTGWTI